MYDQPSCGSWHAKLCGALAAAAWLNLNPATRITHAHFQHALIEPIQIAHSGHIKAQSRPPCVCNPRSRRTITQPDHTTANSNSVTTCHNAPALPLGLAQHAVTASKFAQAQCTRNAVLQLLLCSNAAPPPLCRKPAKPQLTKPQNPYTTLLDRQGHCAPDTLKPETQALNPKPLSCTRSSSRADTCDSAAKTHMQQVASMPAVVK
jgi:hypothetical protein